jgi:hypothetical protein
MVSNLSSIYKNVPHHTIFVFADSPLAPISSRCALLATRCFRLRAGIEPDQRQRLFVWIKALASATVRSKLFPIWITG